MSSIHKIRSFLPYQRREAYRRRREGEKAADLARHCDVSRKTLYEVFKKAKLGVFVNYSSKNLRYRTLEYGLKRLAKTEAKLVKKLTKSVPLTRDLEDVVNSLVKKGYAPNKAEVMRKALIFLAEEEVVQDVLRAEKEPILRGDLRELAKRI